MILAIDIGGTSAKMAFVNRRGEILDRLQVSTAQDHYETPILKAVAAGAREFLLKTPEKAEGIAVSATGQIDGETGTVIGTNGKIPHYEGARIKETLEKEFQVPVTAINDANAAALGECVWGRARGCRNVVMVTLGTGVGGGIVADSRLYGGKRGIAGEIGHFTLYQNGAPCPCGKKGCYESYASATALIKAAEKATGETGLTGKTVFARAIEGDPIMKAVLDQWTDDIAAGISSLVHIFNPEMVLLGGGVSSQKDLLISPVRQKVLSQVMPRFAEQLQIEGASLGNDAGLLGAAAYWVEKNSLLL